MEDNDDHYTDIYYRKQINPTAFNLNSRLLSSPKDLLNSYSKPNSKRPLEIDPTEENQVEEFEKISKKIKKTQFASKNNIFENANTNDPRRRANFYQNMTLEEEEPSPPKNVFNQDFISFKKQEKDDPNELENNYSTKIKKIIPKGGPIESKSRRYAEVIPKFTGQKFLNELKQYDEKDFINRLSQESRRLPIFDLFREILAHSNTINQEKEQVLVISGDTGCGKSTQVPKYIYIDGILKGSKAKIICTQPRRMAAMNLAKRVSRELDTALGSVVGYQISLDSRQSEDTAILYVTNGIFLQRLIHEKDMLTQVTHVILDEVHERDIDSDFLMIAIKHLLKDYPQVKLILMSATINVQLFINYFSYNEIKNCLSKEFNYNVIPSSKVKWDKIDDWDSYNPKEFEKIEEEINTWDNIRIKKEKDNFTQKRRDWGDGNATGSHFEQYEIQSDDQPAYSIEIPHERKNYEVINYYIDNIDHFLQKSTGIEFRYIDFDRKKPGLYLECVQLAIEIIKFIIFKDDKDSKMDNARLDKFAKKKKRNYGSFLIFLPGLNEINNFIIKIEESLEAEKLNSLKIIPLHSALSDAQNSQIFMDFSMEENFQRKIIVSTNIAESSITVPDVVYVIDFCLSKETTYNPYNSMEKLELAWASQASCRQRAGRTGRVGNGYCFRLVPRYFFEEQLLAFTTPELLRSPLDKLILRIKTINEDDPKDIFSDPQKVLGRAIQPPHIDNISFAYKSLQDAGALTWSLDNSYKSCKITEIGRIYCDLPCDIKICKMCVLGFVFNCLQEAITIASILQHQKTMFIMNTRVNPRDQSSFYKNISSYDRGHNSDLILMLNIFCEWEDKFGLNLLRQSNDPNVSAIYKPIKRKRIDDPIEKDWCKENYLDPVILREILFQREDLKQRLLKYNFQLSYYKPINRDNQEMFLKLKVLFGASFNGNFLRAFQKMDLKMEKKLYNLKNSLNINTRCALIINYSGFNSDTVTPQELILKENEWREFFNTYGPVEKVKFNYNEAYVIFKDSSYENAIKFLLYKKALSNNTKQIFKNDQSYQKKENPEFLSKYDKEKIFLDQIGAFDYLHICQFSDLLRGHSVVIDNDSINKFVFSLTSSNMSSFEYEKYFSKELIPGEQRSEPRVLICFDYQERNNNKNYSKHTTLLPDIPLIAPLLLLVFSALPRLKTDSDHKRYEKVAIDENEIFLDYYLSDKDVEDINKLRLLLRMNLNREGLSQTPSDTFWNLLKELLIKERIKYYDSELWEETFQRQTNKYLNLDAFLNEDKSKFISKFARKFIPSSGNNPQIDNRRIIDYQLYLPEIEKIPLENAMPFDISKEEGKLKYKMYQESYNQWKLKVLDDLQTHRKFLEIKQTYIACGKCKLPISDIKNLKEKDSEIFFLRKFIPNPYDVSTLNFNLDDDFCTHDQYFEVDELFGKDLEYYGCRNDHIIGIRPKNVDVRDWFLYVTEHSNLIVLYPDLTEEKFDFYKFDMKRVLEIENIKLKKKKQVITEMRYDCHICQEINMGCEMFLKHVKDNKKHKEGQKEFQNSLRKVNP